MLNRKPKRQIPFDIYPNVTAEVQSSEEAEKESMPNLWVEAQARENIRLLAPALNAHTESALQALTDQAGIQLSASTTGTEKNDCQEDPNKEIQAGQDSSLPAFIATDSSIPSSVDVQTVNP
ncbi:hypothetical protein Dimus_018789 [Dionaea muscipula]